MSMLIGSTLNIILSAGVAGLFAADELFRASSSVYCGMQHTVALIPCTFVAIFSVGLCVSFSPWVQARGREPSDPQLLIYSIVCMVIGISITVLRPWFR